MKKKRKIMQSALLGLGRQEAAPEREAYVVSGEMALAMRKQTGCDGVMIGRGAQGNPWIFRELVEYERTGILPDRPSREEIKEAMLRHARLQIEFKGDYSGIREMRKHVAWYTKGLCGAAKLRDAVNQVESYDALVKLLDISLSGIGR